jgi:ceramide glucosyltransferase
MIGSLALTWAIVVASVSGVAIARACMARRRRTVAVARAWRSIVVLRPCAGLEPGLAEALESSRHASSIGARVRFLVARDDDAAAPIASRIADRLGAEGLDVAARTTNAEGPNGKCAQLAAALVDDASDLVIVADSDVRLGPADLARLVAALGDTHAAAWASPVESSAPQSIGDRASQALLRASLHAFVLLGQLDRGGLVGKLVAIDRSALDAIGGFASMLSVLGEDMELARRLRSAGRSIVAAPVVATSLASGRTLRQAIDRTAAGCSSFAHSAPGSCSPIRC